MVPSQVQLPMPHADALAHSARMLVHLRECIARAGGWLDFAAFMEQVLYAPGLGYYAAGAARFNAAGDFTTAPEISPLFGRTLARALAPGLQAMRGQGGGALTVLEPGAGTGRLALSLLPALAELEALPDHYCILEPSPALQAEQQATLQALPEALRGRVRWLQALPAPFRGAVVANEVLDALPVHVLQVVADGSLQVGGVRVGPDAALAWAFRPAAAALQAEALARWPGGTVLPPGTRLELARAAPAWAATVAATLQQGMVVLVDYGFAARELYLPQRTRGTLMCHYRHHAHDDPFWLPGLQDLTAHVDFTAVAQALQASGLVLQEFSTQAAFLLGHGLLDAIDPALTPGSVDWLRQTTALQKLVSPAEMGESFKVLVAVQPGLADAGGHRLPPAALFDGSGPLACASQLGLPEGTGLAPV